MAPKKKVPQKSPQTKKGKKKVEPARKPRRARPAPKKEKPFRLEVGKTYVTAGGHKAAIHAVKQGGWFSGEWIFPFPNPEFVAFDVWFENGSWISGHKREQYDLVREVRPVKARGK
jgi:hypothetical protein